MDYHGLKRKELQILCKKHGIPANLKNIEMADRLSSLLNKKEEKPTKRGRPCLKNVIVVDVDEDEDEAVQSKEPKKVKFSPQNETFVFEKTDPRDCRELRLLARKKRGFQKPDNEEGLLSAVGNVDKLEFADDVEKANVRVLRRRSVVIKSDSGVDTSTDDVDKPAERVPTRRSVVGKPDSDLDSKVADNVGKPDQRISRRKSVVVKPDSAIEPKVVEDVGEPVQRTTRRKSIVAKPVVVLDSDESDDNVGKPVQRPLRSKSVVAEPDAVLDTRGVDDVNKPIERNLRKSVLVKSNAVVDTGVIDDVKKTDGESGIVATDLRPRGKKMSVKDMLLSPHVEKKAKRSRKGQEMVALKKQKDDEILDQTAEEAAQEKSSDMGADIKKRQRGRKTTTATVKHKEVETGREAVVEDLMVENVGKDMISRSMKRRGLTRKKNNADVVVGSKLDEQVADDDNMHEMVANSVNQSEMVGVSTERPATVETDLVREKEIVLEVSAPIHSLSEKQKIDEQCHATGGTSYAEKIVENSEEATEFSSSSSQNLYTMDLKDWEGETDIIDKPLENVVAAAGSPVNNESSTLQNDGDFDAKIPMQANKEEETSSNLNFVTEKGCSEETASTPPSSLKRQFSGYAGVGEPKCHSSSKTCMIGGSEVSDADREQLFSPLGELIDEMRVVDDELSDCAAATVDKADSQLMEQVEVAGLSGSCDSNFREAEQTMPILLEKVVLDPEANVEANVQLPIGLEGLTPPLNALTAPLNRIVEGKLVDTVTPLQNQVTDSQNQVADDKHEMRANCVNHSEVLDISTERPATVQTDFVQKKEIVLEFSAPAHSLPEKQKLDGEPEYHNTIKSSLNVVDDQLIDCAAGTVKKSDVQPTDQEEAAGLLGSCDSTFREAEQVAPTDFVDQQSSHFISEDTVVLCSEAGMEANVQAPIDLDRPTPSNSSAAPLKKIIEEDKDRDTVTPSQNQVIEFICSSDFGDSSTTNTCLLYQQSKVYGDTSALSGSLKMKEENCKETPRGDTACLADNIKTNTLGEEDTIVMGEHPDNITNLNESRELKSDKAASATKQDTFASSNGGETPFSIQKKKWSQVAYEGSRSPGVSGNIVNKASECISVSDKNKCLKQSSVDAVSSATESMDDFSCYVNCSSKPFNSDVGSICIEVSEQYPAVDTIAAVGKLELFQQDDDKGIDCKYVPQKDILLRLENLCDNYFAQSCSMADESNLIKETVFPVCELEVQLRDAEADSDMKISPCSRPAESVENRTPKVSHAKGSSPLTTPEKTVFPVSGLEIQLRDDQADSDLKSSPAESVENQMHKVSHARGSSPLTIQEKTNFPLEIYNFTAQASKFEDSVEKELKSMTQEAGYVEESEVVNIYGNESPESNIRTELDEVLGQEFFTQTMSGGSVTKEFESVSQQAGSVERETEEDANTGEKESSESDSRGREFGEVVERELALQSSLSMVAINPVHNTVNGNGSDSFCGHLEMAEKIGSPMKNSGRLSLRNEALGSDYEAGSVEEDCLPIDRKSKCYSSDVYAAALETASVSLQTSENECNETLQNAYNSDTEELYLGFPVLFKDDKDDIGNSIDKLELDAETSDTLPSELATPAKILPEASASEMHEGPEITAGKQQVEFSSPREMELQDLTCSFSVVSWKLDVPKEFYGSDIAGPRIDAYSDMVESKYSGENEKRFSDNDEAIEYDPKEQFDGHVDAEKGSGVENVNEEKNNCLLYPVDEGAGTNGIDNTTSSRPEYADILPCDIGDVSDVDHEKLTNSEAGMEFNVGEAMFVGSATKEFEIISQEKGSVEIETEEDANNCEKGSSESDSGKRVFGEAVERGLAVQSSLLTAIPEEENSDGGFQILEVSSILAINPVHNVVNGKDFDSCSDHFEKAEKNGSPRRNSGKFSLRDEALGLESEAGSVVVDCLPMDSKSACYSPDVYATTRETVSDSLQTSENECYKTLQHDCISDTEELYSGEPMLFKDDQDDIEKSSEKLEFDAEPSDALPSEVAAPAKIILKASVSEMFDGPETAAGKNLVEYDSTREMELEGLTCSSFSDEAPKVNYEADVDGPRDDVHSIMVESNSFAENIKAVSDIEKAIEYPKEQFDSHMKADNSTGMENVTEDYEEQINCPLDPVDGDACANGDDNTLSSRPEDSDILPFDIGDISDVDHEKLTNPEAWMELYSGEGDCMSGHHTNNQEHVDGLVDHIHDGACMNEMEHVALEGSVNLKSSPCGIYETSFAQEHIVHGENSPESDEDMKPKSECLFTETEIGFLWGETETDEVREHQAEASDATFDVNEHEAAIVENDSVSTHQPAVGDSELGERTLQEGAESEEKGDCVGEGDEQYLITDREYDNAMIKKENTRSILIHGTPRKPLPFIHDMKENVTASKRLQMAGATAIKPRRKALEDIGK